MKPILLGPNQPKRFYRGGPRIAAFRGLPATGDRVPEDWVGSTIPLFGQDELGMTRLPSGELLGEAVRRDPVAWLGAAHVERFGDDTALLVKLLDAGERLPVHSHPNSAFARDHLRYTHGKSEAWLILATDGPALVHLGFSADVSAETLARWVRDQDSEAMLAAMHPVSVKPGDCVFVPGGLPHAIGAGLLLLEVQEPTDLSVLLEWVGFDLNGQTDGHLGLGFDVALQCVDRRGWSSEEIAKLWKRNTSNGPVDLPLPERAGRFFRLERLRPTGRLDLDRGFSVLVVASGDGELQPNGGELLPVHQGHTVLVPYESGPMVLSGDLEVLRCRPPVDDYRFE